MKRKINALEALKNSEDMVSLKKLALQEKDLTDWILMDNGNWLFTGKTGIPLVDLLLSDGISKEMREKFTVKWAEETTNDLNWKKCISRLDQQGSRDPFEPPVSSLDKQTLTLLISSGYHYSNITTEWRRIHVGSSKISTLSASKNTLEDKEMLRRVNAEINAILEGCRTFALSKGWLDPGRSCLRVLLEISESVYKFKKFSGNKQNDNEKRDAMKVEDSMILIAKRLGDSRLGLMEDN